MMDKSYTAAPIKGRGTASRLPGRFAQHWVEPYVEPRTEGEPRTGGEPRTQQETIDLLELSPTAPTTELRQETAKSIITRNRSPDVPFNLSINPYRGCEHGCIYCFARPSHAYIDLSPGIDFETKISVKHNAPALLEAELQRPGYQCQPIALGINTDAYQPLEKDTEVTRRLLEVALRFKQPISIITKSALILRDLDLLRAMAEHNLVHVAISVTTLDKALKRQLEPRASSGESRLRTIRELRAAGVPVSVLIAPVIPLLNERELEQIVAAVAEAGAQSASYIPLRLPHEVAPLFIDWLYQHFPQRAGHILSRLKDIGGGRLYNSRFGERMRGQGIFAELINQRFHRALRQHGLAANQRTELNCGDFCPPSRGGNQLSLW
ncbi:PA0069 family radical SAM protein [Spongiibacter nanhainus]|mgnify:CR=1 FL=1|nr:PA0069 family radical SAM protein [Spongiibacter nanhainus]